VTPFAQFCDRVIARLWSALAGGHSAVHALRPAAYAARLPHIAYCIIVNKISVRRFVAARCEVQDWVRDLLAGDGLSELCEGSHVAPAEFGGTAVLGSLCDRFGRAYAVGSCAAVVHAAVRTLEVLSAAMAQTVKEPEKVLQRAVCSVVIHGAIDAFVNWFTSCSTFSGPEGGS
jgi:hypothetical protein